MTRIVVIGKANTITAQLERIQRMGLVPSGPWIVGPVDDCTVTAVDASGERHVVAEIDGDYNEPDLWPIMEANARLISAAPDLLEALKGLIRRYDAENPGAAMEPDGGCIECPVGTVPNNMNTGLCPMHKAIAAIAKAEGK